MSWGLRLSSERLLVYVDGKLVADAPVPPAGGEWDCEWRHAIVRYGPAPSRWTRLVASIRRVVGGA